MKDWRTRTLRLQAKLFVLLYLLPLTSIAEEDFKTWYQIEIIVFKQKQVQNSDETWPFADLHYPANMVKVSPADPNNLSPQTLGQLKDLLAYEDLIFADEGDEGDKGDGVDSLIARPIDNFMFKSRSRQAPAAPIIEELDNLKDNKNSEFPLQNDLSGEDAFGNSAGSSASASNLTSIDLDALFDPQLPQAFKALERNKHQLGGISRSINRSSLYELLLHQAWLQPVTSASTSKPVLIQLGSHYDDSFEIDGTIKLSRSRFLHLATDLWFTEFTALYQQASTPLTLDLSPASANKYSNVVNWESNRGKFLPVHSHRLVHSRRMRRSTLHFIDHPRFGILVQVEKFEYSPEL